MTQDGGWAYAHPAIYDAMLAILYRGRARQRFRAVAAQVEPGAEVVDLCAGTAMLYDALRGRADSYRAFDLNARLVAHLKRRGIRAHQLDVAAGEWPRADVVTMCSSLYQFHPDCRSIVERMVATASARAIILEPVHNAANSRFGAVRWLGRRAGRVGGREMPFYFDPDTFTELVASIDGLESLRWLDNGRDMLAVFRGAARPGDAAQEAADVARGSMAATGTANRRQQQVHSG